MQVQYGGHWADWHGGPGGSLSTWSFQPEERVIITMGRARLAIDNLAMVTYRKAEGKYHAWGPAGGPNGNKFIAAPDNGNCYQAYISGKSNANYVTQLSLHWNCQ